MEMKLFQQTCKTFGNLLETLKFLEYVLLKSAFPKYYG